MSFKQSRLVGHPQKNRTLLLILFTITAHTPLIHLIVTNSLKTKGLDVSHTGISVKTSKRFDHEEYMEATRRCVLSQLAYLFLLILSNFFFLRGLVKVAGASSFGKPENATNVSSQSVPRMERVSSDSSSIASQEKKKKGFFRSRK